MDLPPRIGPLDVDFQASLDQLRHRLSVMDTVSIHFNRFRHATKHFAEAPAHVQLLDSLILSGRPKEVVVETEGPELGTQCEIVLIESGLNSIQPDVGGFVSHVVNRRGVPAIFHRCLYIFPFRLGSSLVLFPFIVMGAKTDPLILSDRTKGVAARTPLWFQGER